MLWLAVIASLAVQDTPEDLRKEIQKLREKIQFLEQSALEDAQTIQRLRQAVKLLDANAASGESAPAKPPPPLRPLKPEGPAPLQPIKTKVAHVDAKMGFLAINLGKKEGVLPGYKFEIYRQTYEPGSGEEKLTRLGVAEFEKYLGQDSMSKLVVTEGNIQEMKADDLAVAIRKLAAVAPPKETPEAPVAPALPAPEGVYAITGRAGTGPNAGFVINYGSTQGARQTDLVYVYKDGTFKAKLRLDKVEKTYSLANIVGAADAPPEQGDQIYTREIKKGLTGKVALADERRGVVIDLKQRDGVKVGQRFDVRRRGVSVGTIILTDVQGWGTWAKPDGDTKIEQIQKGDLVEVIEEK